MDTALEKGITVELEHRELIVTILKKAGEDANEDQVRQVAALIAKVHLKEDPDYYDKLEKMEQD